MSIYKKMGRFLRMEKYSSHLALQNSKHKTNEFPQLNYSSDSQFSNLVLEYNLNEFENLINKDLKIKILERDDITEVEKVILFSLIDYTEIKDIEQENDIDEVVYTPSPSDNKNIYEKNLYDAIEDVLYKMLSKTKNVPLFNRPKLSFDDKQENLTSTDANYTNLKDLLMKLENNNESLEFIAIKAIILSLMNIMNKIIDTTKFYLNDHFFYLSEFNCESFNQLYEYFLIMTRLCPKIENFFEKTFEIFKETYSFNFKLSELFGDIFWDKVFGIKRIAYAYIENFNSQEINVNTKVTLQNIAKFLWEITIPFKAKISEILNIIPIKENKNDLSSIIIRNKSKKSFINENVLCRNIEESNSKISFSQVNDFTFKNKGDIKVKEKSSDFCSIDELYQYIIDTETKKKKRKRIKRKNTNYTNNTDENTSFGNNNINITRNNSNVNCLNNDPVVDKFKSELISKDAGEIQKIKVNISEVWLQSINLH